MKLKVCGLNNPFNIKELSDLNVDYFGYIFYKNSLRYYGKEFRTNSIMNLRKGIGRVGVFVNANEFEIMNTIADYQLDHVQLHGNETPELCEKLKPYVKVIKAFHLQEHLDIELMKPFTDVCDYFLFDTKTKNYGGAGKKFDWRILEEYKLTKPFFLSGGISLEDAETIRNLDHPYLYGVDINSKFEIIPGTKDKQLVKEFIEQIKL